MSAPKGGSLGRSLAGLLGDTTVKARAALLPHEHAARAEATKVLMERFEAELAPVGRAIVGDALDDPAVPEDIKAQLRPLAEPQHQTAFLLQLLALPFALFGLASASEQGNIDYFQTWARERRPVLPLPPADAATAVVKGEMTMAEAIAEAAKSGYNSERFVRLWAIAGEPPGLMQLLEAFRRGYIDAGRLEHGIRQSRVKDEWIDVVTALRYAPVGPGEVLAGAVQNHLSADEARRRLSEAGVDPSNFGWLFETHGRPPGIGELLDLLNRGEVTEAEVGQAIRESDVKDKYLPAILKMRRRLMPERTVVSGVGKGVLTPAQGLDRLLKLGFDAEDAAALVAEAHKDKTVNHRALAESQIVTGYIDRLHSRPEADQMLQALGYDASETAFLLDLADTQRERRFTDAAINRTHARYVGHHLDRAAAGDALSALGVPGTQRDDLLKLWDLERDVNAPNLSLTQLEGLLRRGAIDQTGFLERTKRLGYTDDDAQLLLFLAFPAPRQTPPPP